MTKRSNPASKKLHNGSAGQGFCPRPCSSAAPMEQIGNHIGVSGKIYVTRADGSGQGSWLPSQSDSSRYSGGVAILFRTHPGPRVIFSGDYNTPPLSQRNAHVQLAVRWNTMAYHFHLALTSFFLTDMALGGLIWEGLLYSLCFLLHQHVSWSLCDRS